VKKTIALSLLFVLAFALSAAAAPAPAKKAATPAVPASAKAGSSGNLAVGCAFNFPTLKYQFSDEIIGTVGAMNASGGGASSTALLIKADYLLTKVGAAQPCVGLYYGTNGAAAATTVMGVTWGVSTLVASNLSVGLDLVMLSSTTFGGASTTGILGAGLVGASQSAFLNVSYYL
jgi:hypothetical protein